MKYLELREFQVINSHLVFTAEDCRIVGKCELYTTKAAGSDKKLCKTIEKSLEQKYVDVVDPSISSSASTSNAMMKSPESLPTGGTSMGSSTGRSLSLAKSPFGPLTQSASRRTFAYIVATLNASHPDHDFTNLRPFDFKKERSLSVVVNALNTTLKMQGHISTSGLWETIDRHIDLNMCDIFSYQPDSDSDPYGEDGLLWSQSYFFFSKEQKRVLYFTLRGVSLRSPPLRADDYESDASDDYDGAKSVFLDDIDDMEL
ncbi:RNA polymerase III-inhibiting protein maf1 [Savitreella phatthalungensis]